MGETTQTSSQAASTRSGPSSCWHWACGNRPQIILTHALYRQKPYKRISEQADWKEIRGIPSSLDMQSKQKKELKAQHLTIRAKPWWSIRHHTPLKSKKNQYSSHDSSTYRCPHIWQGLSQQLQGKTWVPKVLNSRKVTCHARHHHPGGPSWRQLKKSPQTGSVGRTVTNRTWQAPKMAEALCKAGS